MEDARVPPPTVAVFGSADPLPGEPLYEEAREVGRLLARDGWRVATGGYGGVMEGASRGAREAGGATVGVVSTLFRSRRPNRHLTQILTVTDLHDRMRALVELGEAYVVLWGKSGTLAEAALVWALLRAGSLPPRPVLLLGARWERLLAYLRETKMLEGDELRSTRVALTPAEVPAALRELAAFLRGD
jgi:uncharacterized protein (TIGR00730 family)